MEEYGSVFAIFALCFGILVGWLVDYPRRKLGFDEFTARLTKVHLEYQKKWPNWAASLIGGVITFTGVLYSFFIFAVGFGAAMLFAKVIPHLGL